MTGTYPNPFNCSTVISFIQPVKSIIELEVYVVAGRKLIIKEFNSLPEGLNKTDL